jgi:tRNA threonylcarbamoyladenosine biosynthesis protein TsaB
MLILTIRTDKPDSELGLFENREQLLYETWPAHRQLAETIHLKIKELLDRQQKVLTDLDAILVYKGPGSFTGLRIGITVANTLADSLVIPIVGTEEPDWLQGGIGSLIAGQNEKSIVPTYGSEPHITLPKH